MANLKEKSKWEEGIYQLEENDPVVGGEDGISNKQAKQLANRTTYLKKELEKPATTEQVGRVQLVDDLTTNDNSKALTAKQGLTLKGFIDSLTRNLGNYIPNSKKSNAVNSSSSDTVATSAAAKTAYDRGTQGISTANAVGVRVSTLEAETWKFDQKILSNGADLNDIRQPGFYRKTANAYTMQNEPTSVAFDMLVMSIQGDNTNYAKQLVFEHHTNKIFSRVIKSGNNIGQWERVDSLDNVPNTGGSITGDVDIKANLKVRDIYPADGANGWLDLRGDGGKGVALYSGGTRTLLATNTATVLNTPISTNNNMYIFNYEGDDTSNPSSSGNVDGFWWEDSSNTIYFQGDRPHKSKTDLRTTLKAKEFETENGKKLSEVITIDDLVGIPIPYPKTNVPSGFLAMNGQRFSTSRYPKLAKLYPTGKLPDLRGEFIRGWDNGRNVDRGREILSSQGDLFKTHAHDRDERIDTGGFAITGTSGFGNNGTAEGLPSSGNGFGNKWSASSRTGYEGGGETRPRNVAFQYICLAG